jgi:hypothetical protein
MTAHVAMAPDPALRQAESVAEVGNDDADIRWRAWKARGVEQDRRTMTTIRRTIVLTAIAFAIWVWVLSV